MRKTKHISLILAMSLILAAGSACSKSVPEASVISDSASIVSEEKGPVTSVSETEEEKSEIGVFKYSTWTEFDEDLLRMTRKELLKRGAIGEDEKLFYQFSDVDIDETYEWDEITSENVWDSEMPFISFDENGIKNIFIAVLNEETNGVAARINSFRVVSLDEYSREKKDAGEDYKCTTPMSLSWILVSELSWLRTDSLDDTKAFINEATADGTLTKHSRVIDYIYEKSADKEMFKDPVKLAKFFFPCLKDKELDSLKADEESVDVTYIEDGALQVITFYSFRKLSGNERVYYPASGYPWMHEQVVNRHEILDNVTAEKLDEAYDTQPAWGEGGLSSFYKAAENEDTGAVLYGLFQADSIEGAVLRTKDEIIPVFAAESLDWGTELYAGDFDGDGKTEYAFTTCGGHGTGYFQEVLYVVDPGEKNNVCRFDNYNDLSYGSVNPVDFVKYEYDEENGDLNFWLDENGTLSSRGNMIIDEAYRKQCWDEGDAFNSLVFGDLFYITFEGDKLGFRLLGGITTVEHGIPDYTYAVALLGDINYKNGVITYDNLRLVPEIAQ